MISWGGENLLNIKKTDFLVNAAEEFIELRDMMIYIQQVGGQCHNDQPPHQIKVLKTHCTEVFDQASFSLSSPSIFDI